MILYYVVEYDVYQRRIRHFFFIHKPSKVGNMYNEPSSDITIESPSFIEILDENLPDTVKQFTGIARIEPVPIQVEFTVTLK